MQYHQATLTQRYYWSIGSFYTVAQRDTTILPEEYAMLYALEKEHYRCLPHISQTNYY